MVRSETPSCSAASLLVINSRLGIARIGRATPRVEHEHVVTRLDAICQERNEILDLGGHPFPVRAQLAPISGERGDHVG